MRMMDVRWKLFHANFSGSWPIEDNLMLTCFKLWGYDWQQTSEPPKWLKPSYPSLTPMSQVAWAPGLPQPAPFPAVKEALLVEDQVLRGQVAPAKISTLGKKILTSRGLTYPTLGKGKSSSKCHFWKDMLVSWRVSSWWFQPTHLKKYISQKMEIFPNFRGENWK